MDLQLGVLNLLFEFLVAYVGAIVTFCYEIKGNFAFLYFAMSP